jgi:hypothetical protein
MVRTKSAKLGLIGLPLAVALVIASTMEVAAQGTPNGRKTLVGAWFNTVTPTLVDPFVGLGTFGADGTLTNISSVSLGSPLESPGFGQWVKTGPDTYAVTFLTISADAAGHHTLTSKVRATLRVSANGDDFTGDFPVDFFAADVGSSSPIRESSQGRGSRSSPCHSNRIDPKAGCLSWQVLEHRPLTAARSVARRRLACAFRTSSPW